MRLSKLTRRGYTKDIRDIFDYACIYVCIYVWVSAYVSMRACEKALTNRPDSLTSIVWPELAMRKILYFNLRTSRWGVDIIFILVFFYAIAIIFYRLVSEL